MRTQVLYIALAFLYLFGCHSTSNNLVVDVSSTKLNLNNGILYYDDALFDGILVSTYDSGAKKSKIEYVAGKKHGAETRWYENGDKLLERFYVEGFKTGVHKSWWENGNLKFEYYFNDKGEHNGVMNEWYQSGQPLRAFNYQNGKEVGTQKLWKPDGRIKANYEVVNGERFGLIGLKKCYKVTVNRDEIE
ncbi:hypothetical protein MHTCC0001_22520 [Flavobacteriaceae bacterium MHTCC 0001]